MSNFEKFIDLMKEIELDIRGNGKIERCNYEKCSNLSEWDYRIIIGFITEVNLAIQRQDLNFVYKRYDIEKPFKNKIKKDIFISCLKRDQRDTILTDVQNRLVIPKNLSYEYFECWGMNVDKARNLSVNQALEKGCKYLLFIDDDMVVENTSLMKLYETMIKTNKLVVSANYLRKADYEISAHGQLENTDIEYLKETDLCAMGFTLINLDEITKKVPMPLFWIFAAPDGYWSMGEDAFFTKNLFEFTNEKPIIDLRPSVLHYDKIWKRCFGKRLNNITYATNEISLFEKFDFQRQPPQHPLVVIATPTRNENDPISTNLDSLLILRGYKSQFKRISGFPVDQARNILANESVKLGSEFLLFIDNDIVLPQNALTQMLEIMADDKDHEIGAVTGDYLLKGKVSHSSFLQLNNEGIVTELNRIDNNDKIIDSNWLIGLGCCLIRTEVFRQIRQPYFQCYSPKLNDVGMTMEEDGGINEDAHFTELLLMNGYKVKIVRDLKCLHIDFKNNKMYGYDSNIDLSKFSCFEWINNIEYVGI